MPRWQRGRGQYGSQCRCTGHSMRIRQDWTIASKREHSKSPFSSTCCFRLSLEIDQVPLRKTEPRDPIYNSKSRLLNLPLQRTNLIAPTLDCRGQTNQLLRAPPSILRQHFSHSRFLFLLFLLLLLLQHRQTVRLKPSTDASVERWTLDCSRGIDISKD